MPRIAHRRRGSEFGHHPFVFALVTPPLLPLALSTSSLRRSLVLTLSSFAPIHSLAPACTLTCRTPPVPLDSPRPILSTPKLADATGLPVRSLPSSTSAHVVLIVVVLLLGLAPVTVDGPQHLRQLSERVDLQRDADDAPVLPQLESSSASASSPASASSRSAPGRNGPSSASSMPLIHQRRQHIISNTPDATNPVQTILQPDIPNPPRLTKTLPVPSMVRMAPMRQHAPSLTAPTLSAVVKPAAPPTPAPAPQPTLPKDPRR